MVLEEAVVLGGQHGMTHQLGDLVVGDGDAPLLTDLRYQPTAARIDPQGHLQLDPVHVLGRGQRGRQVDVGAGEGENPGKSSPPTTTRAMRSRRKTGDFTDSACSGCTDAGVGAVSTGRVNWTMSHDQMPGLWRRSRKPGR